MSDEQMQQGVDLSGEYEVDKPKAAAQPKATAQKPVTQTQPEEGGVDLSQDYEVGGKTLAGKPAASTTDSKKNPAYNDPTKDSPYASILTHPWESIKHAADYYTQPDVKTAAIPQPVEKPRANPQGVPPQVSAPPANLPPSAKMPTMDVNYVSPVNGAENKPLPKNFTERPTPSLPTDEQITAAHQKMVQKGT